MRAENEKSEKCGNREEMREILARVPVMPVLTVHDAGVAADLARALVEGGIFVFEVLMRTPAAAEAIRAMVGAAPRARIGAGTLLRPDDVARAVDAGAAFGVAPGLTEALGRAVNAAGLPFLPGVATASEVMAAMEQGFSALKFFPAHGAAGIAWLKSVAGVFPAATFCPTGGIRVEDVPGYLALPNCGTIGCSWVAPADLVQARDWRAISELARRAAAMRP
jgi:2-dehydro-3-deoxyphosphogluconate aldolase/(4S)-4-hydroxy-2-oxoglutarate aldolase